MSELLFPVVTDAEFPHGLRCSSCGRVIGVGQPYVSQEEGMYSTGETQAVLTCVYCPEG